jgi:DNA-binding transcriptional regulator YiaG
MRIGTVYDVDSGSIRSAMLLGECMSGAEVRRLRKAAGLTQGALARRLGVQKSTVYRWETGRTRITRPMARLIRLVLR